MHQTAAASATTVARVVELEFDALAAAELTKVDIAAALEKARAKRAERAELKADWVVEELRKIGFANMADYMKSTTEGDLVCHATTQSALSSARSARFALAFSPLPANGTAPMWTDATAPFTNWPLTRTLSGEVTSSNVLVPVSSHCFAWVATTDDRYPFSPTSAR